MSDEQKDALDSGDSSELPALDFATFVLSLSHSVLVHLGDAPDPSGAGRSINLGYAKHTIDTLAMLQEKTKGNLNGDEERILSQVLFDLRMRFVEVKKSEAAKAK
jgi:hypothetical protein